MSDGAFEPEDPERRRKRHAAFIAQCRVILARAAVAHQRRFVMGLALVDAFWALRDRP